MEKLVINKSFAEKYNKSKERQELRNLKQKYTDAELSEESSSSESEDEEAKALTPQIERDFAKTLALIRSRDPKIYEKDATFFKEEEENESDSKSNSKNEEKRKPLYLKDHERQRLENRGVKALVSDSESEDEEVSTSKVDDITYVKEQQMLKDSFKNFVDSEEECDEEFLTLRKTSPIQDEDKSDISPEEDEEAFLANYISKREYCDEDQNSFPVYNDVVENEESESEVDREEEFERKFNFRYEEPDENFIKMYPRTIKESVRRKDESRKSKRDARKERKKKEKEEKCQEIRKLKNLKRKEILDKIETLKDITGNAKVGFLEDDLDGDFDPKKYDELMTKIYDGEFYNAEEHKKPMFEDNEPLNDWDDWSYEQKELESNGSHILPEHDKKIQPDSGSRNKRAKTSKSKFAESLTKSKPAFDPGEKTFEEYFDEYYKLDYEDIIGDLPVRFKYREVMPNNYGLTTDEILEAEDVELNRWCSLGRTSKYLSKDEEFRDRQKYKKKARSRQRKSIVFPSIYENESGESAAKKKKDESKNANKKKLTLRNSILMQNTSMKNTRIDKKGKNGGILRHFKGKRKISSQRLAAYGLEKKRKRTGN